jgi:hypothetical protein
MKGSKNAGAIANSKNYYSSLKNKNGIKIFPLMLKKI